MGITAEHLAERDVDLAASDRTRSPPSRTAAPPPRARPGASTDEIVPVEVKVKQDDRAFDQDEHIRDGRSRRGDGASCKPVFKADGTVTAGNASGINDAGAAVVLMSSARRRSVGAPVRGRILAYASCGVDPQIMGIGPVPAARKVLERAGRSLDEVGVIELNEAFAAQALAVIDELGLDEAKVNPNGGAIALGHPIGATGAAITVKLPRRDGARRTTSSAS